jgi:LPXTG-motif cell wall-anchored protein
MNALHARRWMLAVVMCGSLALATAAFATTPNQPGTIDETQNTFDTLHQHAHHGSVYNVSRAAAQQNQPSVTVSDQAIVDDTITVDEIIAAQDGWAVVHTLDAQGRPVANQVVGSTQVREGANTDVEIELTESFTPGDQLQVMLHIDEGTKGTLEFPSGPDAPVAVDGQVVAGNFTVLEGDDAAQPEASPSPAATRLPNTGASDVLFLPLFLAMLLICAGVFYRRVARVSH